MDAYDVLLELEDPLRRLCDGVNAVYAFYLAMEYGRHELTGGLWAVWQYLHQQSETVRQQYDAGLEQLRAS